LDSFVSVSRPAERHLVEFTIDAAEIKKAAVTAGPDLGRPESLNPGGRPLFGGTPFTVNNVNMFKEKKHKIFVCFCCFKL